MILETCPGCAAALPPVDTPAHRYIGASPSCWAVFATIMAKPIHPLLGDAYAAQHPGVESAQSIQSVAIHLLTLCGVLERGVDRRHALWIRRRALRERGVFRWLEPPPFDGTLTIADVVLDRSRAGEYIESVWRGWAREHTTILSWYERYVERD